MTRTLPAAVATRLEKVTVDNGFDLSLPSNCAWLAFASSQAPLRIWLTAPDDLPSIAGFLMAHVAAGLENFGDSSWH